MQNSKLTALLIAIVAAILVLAGVLGISRLYQGDNTLLRNAAVGSDTIRQFGEQAGVNERESAGVLADLLPELINQMTPRGQAPQGADLGGLLKQLLR